MSFDPTVLICSKLTLRGFAIDDDGVQLATLDAPQVRPVIAVRGNERHLIRIVIEPDGATTPIGKDLFEQEGRSSGRAWSIPPERVHHVFVSRSGGDEPNVDWRDTPG